MGATRGCSYNSKRQKTHFSDENIFVTAHGTQQLLGTVVSIDEQANHFWRISVAPRGQIIIAAAFAETVRPVMIQNVSVGRLMVDAAVAAELPIMLGFSVRRDADGRLLFRRDDAPFDAEAVARVIGSCRPSAVGVMHCGLEVMDDALTVLAEAYDGPLMAYPDSGVFVDNVWQCGAGSSNANSATADQMFEFSCRHPRLRVVGGCCGYGPELVCELAQRFDSCADPHLLIS